MRGPGTGFDFVPRSPLNVVQTPAKASERTIVIQREPDDILLFGLRVWLRRVFRAKAIGTGPSSGSGLSQPRQCGDEVLRMLVTGGPPSARGRRHAPPQNHASIRARCRCCGPPAQDSREHAGDRRREVADIAIDDAEKCRVGAWLVVML